MRLVLSSISLMLEACKFSVCVQHPDLFSLRNFRIEDGFNIGHNFLLWNCSWSDGKMETFALNALFVACDGEVRDIVNGWLCDGSCGLCYSVFQLAFFRR